MREFGFEMRLCAAMETDGKLVARQLGASPHGTRVVDIVSVTPGPGFDARRRLTDATIPAPLLDTDLGPGEARRPHDVVDAPPTRRRDLVERGLAAGFLERERRDGQSRVRQVARYPDDWFESLLAVENKPDLTSPGGLELQLRRDVSLALFDRVVLATASHVTGAHLNRLPTPVGVWRVDPKTGEREVVREPDQLPVDDPGMDVLEEHPGRTEVRPVGSAVKTRYRRRIAERAYGKGWRVEFPDCPHVENLSVAGVDGIPYCREQERVVRPADACSNVDGSGPDVDIAACRADHSPWIRDPDGARRRQSGLDRFG